MDLRFPGIPENLVQGCYPLMREIGCLAIWKEAGLTKIYPNFADQQNRL